MISFREVLHVYLFQVRGAPAIGVVGALSLAVELHEKSFNNVKDLVNHVTKRLEFLVTARPTAVNMADASKKLSSMAKMLAEDDQLTVMDVKNRYVRCQ